MEDERLVKENYIVAHETFEDTTETSDYFTIHAEADQLANFPASESYGYYISLYDEYLGLDEPAEGSYNVFSGPAQFAGIPADGSCSDADVYPDEILEIRQHICDGMAAGVLPFVYDAAICEDPLRIEVSVDTADEKLTEEFMSEYDPTGQYIVIVR